MEFLKTNARGIVIALLAVGVITAVSVSGDDDTSETQEETASQTENFVELKDDEASSDASEEASAEESSAFNEDGERESAEVASTDGMFKTVARSGDNQTTLVRDIIGQYKASTEAELSAEQMLFVETNLVEGLPKSDLILVGDELSVSEENVKSTIEAAGQLSESEIALWGRYL